MLLRPLATLINRTLRLYWRVRRPRTFGVRGLIVDEAGRILLVKHIYDRRWYLPGGGRRASEPPEAALRRELAEELGIGEVTLTRHLGTYASTFEGKRDTVDVFVARTGPVTARQALEIAEYGWYAPDALPPDTSAATRRRIAEHRGERRPDGRW